MRTLSPLTLESLRGVALLDQLPDDVLAKLQPSLYLLQFRAGDRILSEGEYCDGAYYLIEGSVDVSFGPVGAARPTPIPVTDSGWAAGLRRVFPRRAPPASEVEPAPVVLAEVPVDLKPGEHLRLEHGDIFGEGSALSRYPIATDISAASDVTCLLIRTPALRAMMDLPELALFKDLFDRRYRARTLRAHLRRVDIFAGLDNVLLDHLCEQADLVTFKPNRTIVEEGTHDDAFFLVRGGYVKVTTRVGEADLAVTYLRKGDCTGESALLLSEPWPFSLVALEHVELVKIGRADMQAVLAKHPDVEARLWQGMLRLLKELGYRKARPLTAQTLQFAMDSGLIHGESVLLIDLETCTRCDECVRACASTHDGIPRFVREGIKFRNFSVPTACYQCTDPVCMIGCPTGAISRPLGTLEVTIDKATCIGCGNCVRRCPWENIQSVPYDSPTVGAQINLATKCDLCIGRADGPACVQMCPHGSAVRVSFKDHERVDGLLSR